jgi:single-strand DNA-binding protein
VAVDRRYSKEGEQGTDYPSVVSFGKAGEFVEKYLKQGTKVLITGRLQTGNYTNKDGVKIYTTDVITEEIEFAESKKASEDKPQEVNEAGGEFMNIDEKVDLPFKQRG